MGDEQFVAQGARIVRRRAGGVRRGRARAEGQGAAGVRGGDAARRARRCSPTCTSPPSPSSPRGLQRSGATCIAYETVEDGGGTPAAAGADERGGGQDRHAGRCVHAREAARRPRHPARRRARRGGGDGAGDRRRRGRHERGVHRDRHAGRRVRVRPLDRPPARAGSGVRRARLDRLLLDAGDRGDAAAGRPGDRRGARARRSRAACGHARAAEADEAPRGARRRVDRSGRLL